MQVKKKLQQKVWDVKQVLLHKEECLAAHKFSENKASKNKKRGEQVAKHMKYAKAHNKSQKRKERP